MAFTHILIISLLLIIAWGVGLVLDEVKAIRKHLMGEDA